MRNPFRVAPQGLKRLFVRVDDLDKPRSKFIARDAYDVSDAQGQTREIAVPEAEANLITSATGVADWHLPVLDLDVPHTLVPSTTPGHSHLYIDVPVAWEVYEKLLRALQDAGILEDGYVRASIAKGGTYVRKPDVKKPGAGIEIGQLVRITDAYPDREFRGKLGRVKVTDNAGNYPFIVEVGEDTHLLAAAEIEAVAPGDFVTYDPARTTDPIGF